MTPRHLARTATAAVVTVAALALSSCAGDAGAPDGWTRVEDGWLQVDVPDTWAEASTPSDPWSFARQDAEGDDASLLLTGAGTFGYYPADTGRGILLASMQVGGYPDFKVVDQTEPVDSGDLHLTRTDFTYAGEDGGDTLHGVLWVGSDPDTDQAVAVQLTGVDLPDDVVSQVQESIAVLDTDATPEP